MITILKSKTTGITVETDNFEQIKLHLLIKRYINIRRVDDIHIDSICMALALVIAVKYGNYPLMKSLNHSLPLARPEQIQAFLGDWELVA